MEEPVKNIWVEELYNLRFQHSDKRHVVLSILAGDFERERKNFEAALEYYNNALSYAHEVPNLDDDCSALADCLSDMAAHKNRPGIAFLQEKLGKVLKIGESGMSERVNARRKIHEIYKGTGDLEKVQGQHPQGNQQHHEAGMAIRANQARVANMSRDIGYDVHNFRKVMSAAEFCEAHIASVHFQTGIYGLRYHPGFFGQKAFTHKFVDELNERNLPAFCTAVTTAYNQSRCNQSFSWVQSTDSRLLVAMLRNNWVPSDEKNAAIESYLSNPKNVGRRLEKILRAEIQSLLPVAGLAAP